MTWIICGPGETEHFKPEEFDCPDLPGTGLAHMDQQFVRKLNRCRTLLGSEMIVSSGYRTVEHSRKVVLAKGLKPEAVPTLFRATDPFDAHTTGHGADIACVGARPQFLLIKAAIAAGLNRIGRDRTHIHLDDEPRLDPNVFWIE